jgi:hypothetical protein
MHYGPCIEVRTLVILGSLVRLTRRDVIRGQWYTCTSVFEELHTVVLVEDMGEYFENMRRCNCVISENIL